MRILTSLVLAMLLLPACGARPESSAPPAPAAPAAPAQASPAAASSPVAASIVGGVQEVQMQVTADGFVPGAVALKAGVPARLRITRKTDSTCATAFQSPDMGVKTTDLPLGKEVSIEFTPSKNGEFKFGCGMDMMVNGRFVVAPAAP